MIEFARQHPLEDQAQAAAVVGVGGAGVNIVDQLCLRREAGPACFVLDTDLAVVRGSVAPEKFLLGREQLRGLGTGGDAELAGDVLAAQREDVADMLGGVRTAVVVCGLGGGTGAGAAPGVMEILKASGAEVVCLAILPFGFESRRRRVQAREALEGLRAAADALWVLHNDRLLQTPGAEEDVRLAWHEGNQVVAAAAAQILRLLRDRALMRLGLEEMQAVLGTAVAGENGWLGWGEGEGPERLEDAVEQALHSPWLEDGSAWARAGGLLAGVLGGPDLSMSDFQEMLRALKRELPCELPVTAGAVIDPAMEGRVRLLLMAAVAEPGGGIAVEEEAAVAAPPPAPPVRETVVEKAPELLPQMLPAGATAQRYFPAQEELPLDQRQDRGRFEKTDPTVLNGQDLDVPTYLRLNLKIRV